MPERVVPTSDGPRSSAEPLPRLSEALALWATAVIAVAGTVALALAHAARLTTPLALSITAGVAVVLAVVGVRLAGGLRLDVVAVIAALVVGAATLVLFLPGAPYALSDKDPGVYVIHAFAMEREGWTSVEDPLRTAPTRPPVFDYNANGRLPGLPVDPHDDTLVTPAYYHLWPALQSLTIGTAGERAVFTLTPVLAALSVVLLGLAARAALDGREGTLAGLAVAALCATNMIQVWQAKYPSSEIVAQLLVTGSLLGAAVAIRTQWRPAALVTGLLVTTGFLARADGLLGVVLGVVALGLLIVLRAPARPVRWYAAGLLVPLPYALYNAYVRSEYYSLGNGLPTLATVLLGLAAAAVVTAVAVAIRRAVDARRAPSDGSDGSDTSPASPPSRRGRTALRVLVTVGSAAALLGLWFRGELLGEHMIDYGPRRIRSFDEINLRRLSWFLTVPGVVAAWGGLVALVWRRPPLVRLAVVVAPGLLLAPVYLWAARNSPQLMWWSRRFVPVVLPTVFVLSGTLVAFAVARRSWWSRAAGAALLAFLVAAQLRLALPLREFEEMDGTWEALEALDAVPEGDAVFLWAPGPAGHVPGGSLAASLWFIHDRPGTAVPADVDESVVEAHQEAFPDREVYVVTQGTDLPAGLDPADFELTAELSGAFESLERPEERLPTEVLTLPYDLRVFRYLGSPG